MNNIILLCIFIFVLNIPFGSWRAKVRKFSKQWFFAVHIPVPIIVAMRLFMSIPLSLKLFPLFVLSYFSGQYVGSLIVKFK